jgi:hypothetical protein
MKRRTLLLAGTIALLGCGGARPHTSPPAHAARQADVTELKDIGQLRAAFDAHGDVPQLIVLASPT